MANEAELSVGLEENHFFPPIEHGGKVIGYIKVGRGKIYINDFKKIIAFPADVAFIYDTFILDEYRGKNIAPFCVSEIMRFLKENKFRIVGCHIPKWNSSSISTYEKVGFKKKKYIRYFKFFNQKLITYNPISLFCT